MIMELSPRLQANQQARLNLHSPTASPTASLSLSPTASPSLAPTASPAPSGGQSPTASPSFQAFIWAESETM